MCGPQNDIDIEKEEHLTDILKDLYERWENCSASCGTGSDKKEEFIRAIRRHLDKGFSILTRPGMHHDEEVLERLLHILYSEWKIYIQDDFEPDVGIFIDTARAELNEVLKASNSWKDPEVK